MAFKKAFTIIELLIVIVIVSILATISIVAYTSTTQRAVVSSIQADLTNAKKALLSFQATSPTNSFPTALNCTNPSSTEVCIKTSSSSTTLNYVASGTGTSSAFSLTAFNGDNLYNVTNTSPNPTIYPNIVLNDLVLNVDASNISSYPGAGNNWYDLSGNGTSLFLTNATFSSSNGGYLNFNGASSYSVSTNYNFVSNTLNSHTFTAWIYPSTSNATVVSYGEYNDNLYATGIGIKAGFLAWMRNGVPDVNTVSSSISVPTNQWSFVSITFPTTSIIFYFYPY